MVRGSASETPPASSVVHRKRTQSVGYSNAVEAALALAAELETKEPGNGHSSAKISKEKKAAPAPPLMPMKANNLSTKQRFDWRRQQKKAEQQQSVRKPTETDQGTSNNQKTVHRRRGGVRHPSFEASEFRISSDSFICNSNSESGSGSHGCRFRAADQRQVRPSNGYTRKTSSSLWQQTQSERRAIVDSAKILISDEVVDLLSSSSSSSSESSDVCHSRSMGGSSLSSPMLPVSELPTKAPVKTGKKRLVLTDCVLEKNQPLQTRFSEQHAKVSGHSQSLLKESKRSTNEALRVKKRERVLPQVRRKSGGARKLGMVLKILPTKTKTMKNKKAVMIGRQPRSESVPTSVEQNVTVHLLSSSPSTSSASSSPTSSPRLIPSRKIVKKPSSVSRQAANRVQEGNTDLYERFHRRKSVSSTTAPSEKVSSTVTQPAPDVSVSSLALLSPSPRKKRRVLSCFSADRVSLDDVQAQERELAWIRSHHKQTQNQSRSLTSATKTWKPCRLDLYVDDSLGPKSVACFNEGQQSATNATPPSRVKRCVVADFHRAVLHSTWYRGIFFDEAPSNIICGQVCSEPFDSNCDHSLAFYDETDTLASHCSILENFGKPNKGIPSVFPGEAAGSQSDVTRSVNSLVMTYLPIIRTCYRKKVQSILSEARQKISAYQAALKTHSKASCANGLTPHALFRSSAEKHAVKQLKAVKHSYDLSVGGVSFQIGRGDGLVRERTVSALVQVNYVEEIQPLREYTTSVGLRTNYRVEDDPILPYAACVRLDRNGGGNCGGESTKQHDLRVGHVTDDEVAEYVLRLVVGHLGDSEQVFHALKSELDFNQAYTTYSELKKLYDSRQRAGARLDYVGRLSRDGVRSAIFEVTAILKLMQQSSLINANHSKVLRQRLQPPISNFESSIVDNLVESVSVSMAALGLRASDSYSELVVYSSSFCRMCYMYACHEHGGDYPLPIRRMDPMYPRVRLWRHIPQRDEVASILVSSDKDVVCSSNEMEETVRIRDTATGSSARQEELVPRASKVQQVQWGVYGDVDMSEGANDPQRHATTADPSEYVNAAHVSLVAPKMRLFLSPHSACGKRCWKTGNFTYDQHVIMTPAALGMIRKLRETMGDNSCLLAAVAGGSASCMELYELIQKDISCGEHQKGGGVGRSGRRMRSWKRGQTISGSNRELLQRTRDQRLQDRGTENHEFKPCMHDGLCDSTGCSCMKRDHMCEKACACSRDCPNRFEGCTCAAGECHTSECPCFAALRECDPDVCVSCGASELVVALALDIVHEGKPTCKNMNVTQGKHKQLSMSISSTHGYGIYAREAIAASDFVYEYAGAMISQDEAERRGLIYDKKEMSYLFDLNEDAVLDALRYSNKSKFVNHEGDTPNCTAKVVSACGMHHITIWALHNIAVGEELVFDYGYKRSVGPDWSHGRVVSRKFRSGSVSGELAD